MNTTEHITVIKKQLGITDDSQDAIIAELFERYLSIAKTICIRQDEPLSMIGIVQDIVAGAYNQRGGEGFADSAAGGQNYSHLDLHGTLRKRLIDSGLRLARF